MRVLYWPVDSLSTTTWALLVVDTRRQGRRCQLVFVCGWMCVGVCVFVQTKAVCSVAQGWVKKPNVGLRHT